MVIFFPIDREGLRRSQDAGKVVQAKKDLDTFGVSRSSKANMEGAEDVVLVCRDVLGSFFYSTALGTCAWRY